MCDAIREGRFKETATHDGLTFDDFPDQYLKRYVHLRGLRSAKMIEFKVEVLKKRWKGKPLGGYQGHCSIVVTERYDRQVLATLKIAVGKLDDGQSFKFLSTSDSPADSLESTSSTH